MTWAIVLCQFSDVAQQSATPAFFQNYFTQAGAGSGGAFDYWRDISGGRLVNNSQVFGWFTIPHKSSEIATLNRSVYQQWGFDAAQANGVPLNNFTRRIFFFNANGDHGASGGGTTVFSYAPGRAWEPTFMFHEMGHTLGLPHSFSDGANGCCGSSTPGEYCDPWDIMSAMCVFGFPSPQPAGPGPGMTTAGPGLSAPYLNQLGWLDQSRVFTTWNSGKAFADVDLAPLNQPQLPGFLAARVDIDRDPATLGPASYFVELRAPSLWDRGVPYPAILVHRLANGRSTIMGASRPNRPNLDWKVGEVFDQFFIEPFSVAVTEIDPAGRHAKVRITKHGLNPVWMQSGRLDGPGMHWSRGEDIFVAGDIDKDGKEEVLIANNQNGYIGVLGWSGTALTPRWIVGGRIPGAGMHWSRGADQILAADVDGDGRKEFLIANNQNGYIGILKWTGTALAPIWIGNGRLPGVGMHWSRGEDNFVVADIDHDGHDEVLIANNQNGYIGILKWNGTALAPIWIVGGRIEGAGMHWSRGADQFIAADVDGNGRKAFLIANNQNGYIGLLKWNGFALAPTWIANGQLQGAGMHWSRGPDDAFLAADVDGDGRDEIVVFNHVAQNNWVGVLKQAGAALTPQSVQPIDSLAGPAFRGLSSYVAAAEEGQRAQRILVANANGWTGLFKWNGSGLAQGWFAQSPLAGSAGRWQRAASDQFFAADLDGDGNKDFVVANNQNGWIGVLKWDPVP